MEDSIPKRQIPLDGCTIEASTRKAFCFMLQHEGSSPVSSYSTSSERSYFMSALNNSDKEDWIKVIQYAIDIKSKQKKPLAPTSPASPVFLGQKSSLHPTSSSETAWKKGSKHCQLRLTPSANSTDITSSNEHTGRAPVFEAICSHPF
jgi:hypothetical protein